MFFSKLNFHPFAVYGLISIVTFLMTRHIYEDKYWDCFSTTKSIDGIVMGVTMNDLMAATYWDKNNSEELIKEIEQEHSNGKRDQYFIPKTYISNMNNSHFDDTHLKDEYQKEVYLLARDILRKLKNREEKKLTVIDVGCGSGWKLVHFLSGEFKTIGIETEPAYSFLKKTYPNHTWFNAEKETGNLPDTVTASFGKCDLGISADVVEHFRDPNFLMNILKSYKCRVYVISTPKRESMSWTGPPGNNHHVREWTFHEFQIYMKSHGFRLIRSFNGVKNPASQFHVVSI